MDQGDDTARFKALVDKVLNDTEVEPRRRDERLGLLLVGGAAVFLWAVVFFLFWTKA